jgi:catechol 2,3-dioxygenase-like lactoylglutathione lyase family enzyme
MARVETFWAVVERHFMQQRMRVGALPGIVLFLIGLSGPNVVRAGSFDRIEVNVADPQAAARWYATNLVGRATKVDSAPAVAFGKTTISFSKADGAIGESVGSGIDHLGFSFQNLDEAMRRLARSGVRIVSGIEKDGPIRYAFIHDPWATLIEVVEDPEIRGFHHIHLATTDSKRTLKWYTDVFGGKVTRFAGLIAGIRYGDAWVLVKQVERPLAPTTGRAIDNVSWRVADFGATAKRLRAKGSRFEPARRSVAADRSLFFFGPDEVRLELVARPAQ